MEGNVQDYDILGPNYKFKICMLQNMLITSCNGNLNSRWHSSDEYLVSREVSHHN